MRLRKQWQLLLGIGLAVLIVGAGAVAWISSSIQRSNWSSFRAHCQAQLDTFEAFSEQWIVREQYESFESAAQLLLLGTGLYVDVVLSGGFRVSEQVDDLPTHLVPKSLVVSEAFHALGVREALPELIEIIEPISLEGIPGSVVGLIRIGFSGDYAAARIHSQKLALIGGGLSGWLTLLFASAAFLWQIQRRKLSGDPNDLRIRCGTLSIDPDSREVTLNGIALDLTPKLYGLLHLFAMHPGTVFSDDDLLRALWSDSAYAASADVKQCIYMLRRTLHEAHPNPRRLICNVKGFGYRLDPEATETDLTTD